VKLKNIRTGRVTSVRAPVFFLARNAWDLRTTIEEWPNLRF
jgi:hypothetical protein